MATTKLSALKKLAELPSATDEDKRNYQNELFKEKREHTFEYVISREEFKSRRWMLDQFDETEIARIKSRYNVTVSTYKTRLQKKSSLRFYISTIQNKCATQWFEKKYNMTFPFKSLTLRCLNLYNLNRMEQKWIVVGYKDEYSHNDTNKFGVHYASTDLVFVTYYDNEFVLFGAAKKDDYNRTAYAIEEQGRDKIIMPTELFDDNDTLKSNSVLKNIEQTGYDPAPKKLPKIRRDENRRTKKIDDADKAQVKKNVKARNNIMSKVEALKKK